jgi:hypothetical protein
VTVTHRMRFGSALLIGFVLLMVDALPTAAHAELVSWVTATA